MGYTPTEETRIYPHEVYFDQEHGRHKIRLARTVTTKDVLFTGFDYDNAWTVLMGMKNVVDKMELNNSKKEVIRKDGKLTIITKQ